VNFLQTVALELEKRYNMEEPILSKLPSLSAKSAQSFEHPTLVIISLMTRLVPENNVELIQKIDDEWHSLR